MVTILITLLKKTTHEPPSKFGTLRQRAEAPIPGLLKGVVVLRCLGESIKMLRTETGGGGVEGRLGLGFRV